MNNCIDNLFKVAIWFCDTMKRLLERGHAGEQHALIILLLIAMILLLMLRTDMVKVIALGVLTLAFAKVVVK